MWQLFLIWANWVIKQTWLCILSSLASLAWHMACILYVCWFLAATYQPGHDESHLITHRRLFTSNAGTNTCEQHLCPQATSTSIICPQATSASIICKSPGPTTQPPTQHYKVHLHNQTPNLQRPLFCTYH